MKNTVKIIHLSSRVVVVALCMTLAGCANTKAPAPEPEGAGASTPSTDAEPAAEARRELPVPVTSEELLAMEASIKECVAAFFKGWEARDVDKVLSLFDKETHEALEQVRLTDSSIFLWYCTRRWPKEPDTLKLGLR